MQREHFLDLHDEFVVKRSFLNAVWIEYRNRKFFYVSNSKPRESTCDNFA